MHALSVRQPYAEAIASGEKRREYRTWAPRMLVGSDLLIVASRTPGTGYAGEPQGCAICIVRVAKITGIEDDYVWHLENPRRVQATPIKGYAALFKVADETIEIVRGSLTPMVRPERRERARHATRVTKGPYTFSIEDDAIRGESAGDIGAARKRASELAAQHRTGITILRDGLAIGGEEW